MDDSEQIDLSRASSFRLGGLTVEPSLRQVTGATAIDSLEPRVLQVLVALVMANGRIVSRDDLVRRCWDGRIVGDDSINRVIVRLRRLAEETEAFRIETIPRVGYRLIGDAVLLAAPEPRPLAIEAAPDTTAATGSRAPTVASTVTSIPRAIDRRVALAGGALVVAAASAGGWWAFDRGPGVTSDSVAVLPFANLSGDPAQAYFSDGIAEELRSALTRIVRLKVAARTSSELMRNADAPTAAAKLGVANILTGSVRRGAGTIRISAELIDGKTGLRRWSQSYDRPAGDALAIETGIAESVATALSIALRGAEIALLTIGGTTNAVAHDAAIRGAALLDKNEIGAALAEYDAALAADPNYAVARAARAGLVAAIAGETLGGSALRAALVRTEAEARRAIALAPGLGLPLVVLGVVLELRLDVRGAAAAYAAAYSAAPGDGTILRLYAGFQSQVGRSDEALALIRRAQALDPLRPNLASAIGSILLDAGRIDEAIKALRAGLVRLPDDAGARYDLGKALIANGQPVEARKAVAALSDHDWRRMTIEAIAAARLGDRGASDRELAGLVERHSGDSQYLIAEIHAQRGEADAAFVALDRAFDLGDPGLISLRTHPMLAPIRSDPRFVRLVREIGFS